MKRHLAWIGAEVRPPLLEEVPECSSWALSTYMQCEFRCVYCITGAQGASVPRYSPEELIPELRRELAAIGPQAGIGVGGVCDAYPWVERDHRLTRMVLEELAAQNREFVIITKGTVVVRDVDLLAGNPNASVRISLCTVDEEALRHIDPVAPTAAQRLETLRTLHDAGVTVSVSAEPWIPEVGDVTALIDAVGDEIPIRIAPLNVVGLAVVNTPYGKRFRQAAINAAYRLEFERVGPRPNVRWMRPIPCEGSEPDHHPFAEMRYPAHSH